MSGFRIALLAIAALAASGNAAASSLARGNSLVPTRYDLDLRVDFQEERIAGTARITLKNPGTSPAAEASFLLYRLMTVTAVRDAARRLMPFRQSVVAFEDDPKKQTNHLLVALTPPLEPGQTAMVEIEYGGYLAGYVETGSLYIQDRVDDAFTILREDADAYPTVRVPSHAKNRSAGLPEFDYLARITVPITHVVANGGALVEKTIREAQATYVYRNTKPVWRMDFAIARFGLLEGPGLRVFYLPQDRAGAERVLRAASDSMALYTQWFGPLHDAPAFTVIEIPDGWGSQADVTSILQAAAAFRDPARIHEVYHEASHLWNVASTDRPFCRWNEGLASFLEYLTQEKLSGAPLLDQRAEKTALWLIERASKEPRIKTVPMIDYGKEEMTGYAYSTGMLMFYELYRLAGADAFNEIIGAYSAKHRQGGSTAQLVAEARAHAGFDAPPLFDDWLYTTRWYAILASGVAPQDLAARYRRRPPAK
ncbi:MAG TPA: hypothetical protein VIZ58_03955 [Thermoanaerobaculia bacterium]